MTLKKSILATAIVATLNTGITQAAVIDMSFDGLFTWLNEVGNVRTNDSYPSYGDPTWGYGKRTPITGSMTFDITTGTGTATINPFAFVSGADAIITNVVLQSIGNGLIIGNMNFNGNRHDFTTQVVLDGTALFNAVAGGLPPVNAVLDQSSCGGANPLRCALPASNDVKHSAVPIGLVPIATSSFNVNGATGFGTTLAQLSLGTDDGIGGSPMDNGGFSGSNFNFDFTSLVVTQVSAVPIPAAIWLFGSGSLALLGFARRRKI